VSARTSVGSRTRCGRRADCAAALAAHARGWSRLETFIRPLYLLPRLASPSSWRGWAWATDLRFQALSDVSRSKEEAEKEARRLGALPIEVDVIHVRQSPPIRLRAPPNTTASVRQRGEESATREPRSV
jgi:hypothetical protein